MTPRNAVRRREVTELVALGLTNKEIGQRMGISERTVKFYLSQMFQERGFYGKGSRMKLMLWALSEREK